MDFTLSEEQSAVFDVARSFSNERIAPFASAWEEQGTMPREVLQEAGNIGLGGICVSGDYGGSELSRLDATLIFEALSMACPTVAAFISIHNMCAWMIDAYGSDDLKQSLLPSLCGMTRISSYCLTEPGSGSDAAALKMRATRCPEGYALAGTKSFISGGGYSDQYIVMARTGERGTGGISTFIVDAGTPGLSFGEPERKMGWKAQPTTEVRFDSCTVAEDRLLGQEGDGFRYAMAGLDGGRLNIAACSLGGAQQALNKCIAYVGERKAFGGTLDSFQSIQFKLADMETALQAARIFLRQAAWKLDTGSADATVFCAMAKQHVTDAAFRVANEALQIHGGYGYLSDFGIEKIVRDLRVHQILEGTNEIMRVIVARTLLNGRGR